MLALKTDANLTFIRGTHLKLTTRWKRLVAVVIIEVKIMSRTVLVVRVVVKIVVVAKK